MTILIAGADDDEKFLLQTAFKHKEHPGKLHFAGDSFELMSYLRHCNDENYPGIIIIDLEMPGNNSMEILMEIKQNNLFKRIPIIIFSAPIGEKYFAQCYELGANTCIVKPSTFDKLLSIVQEVYSYLSYTGSIV